MGKTPQSSGRRSRVAAIDGSRDSARLQAGLLIALGAAVAVLQAAFRYPLALPGHHGLEAMALITLGRLLCDRGWSGTLAGTSAATTALLLGAHNPLIPIHYLLPGVALDLAVRIAPPGRRAAFLLPPVAGLAWATWPLVKWLTVPWLHLKADSLAGGLAYPLLAHVLFGTAGSLVAVLLWRRRHAS